MLDTTVSQGFEFCQILISLENILLSVRESTLIRFISWLVEMFRCFLISIF